MNEEISSYGNSGSYKSEVTSLISSSVKKIINNVFDNLIHFYIMERIKIKNE
jgi:hypothetical protein